MKIKTSNLTGKRTVYNIYSSPFESKHIFYITVLMFYPRIFCKDKSLHLGRLLSLTSVDINGQSRSLDFAGQSQ